MRKMTTSILLALSLVLTISLLARCESPTAQRKAAEARLVEAEAARVRARAEADAARIKAEGEARAAEERAKAEADAERQRARAEAEASLASTRQMERDAAHQRMMETLVALALVVLPLSMLAAVAVLLLARQRRAPERALWIYLDQLQLREAARERELWHALATMQRQALPVRDDRQVQVIEVVRDR